jgi:hypothetical protein
MPELPQGRVRHFTMGRLRVKIPEKRRDDAFFEIVKERLATWDSIERIEVNPLTASVLVYFPDLGRLFAENALRNDLFALDYDALEADFETPALTEWTKRRWSDADLAVRRWTSGAADLRGAVLVTLLVAGSYQLFRGNIAAPAATLLWYAGDMLRIWDTPLDKPGKVAGEEAAAED